MRWRAAILALLASGLVGCLGHGAGDERLAQPTDVSVVPPTPTPSTKPPPTPDLSDPGYVTNATWHVGDAWDYETSSGHARTIRVVREAQVGNATFFVTQETEGVAGSTPRASYSRWIDASNWTVANLTDSHGFQTTYSPRLPDRVLRNSSYQYNQTYPGETDAVYANVLYTGRPSVTLPWGEVLQAARFEHRMVEVFPDKSQQRIFAVHVFSADYGNDLSYQIGEQAEVYNLVAVRYGEKSHGSLLPG